ncbi:MAG: hypothetical protein Q4E34_06545 [Synergistaceae bacterium]|nr:hypothetical protein [Synergistaceae bacterium]
MYKADKHGNKTFYCDICGDEIKPADKEAVNMVFSQPNKRENGYEEHFFRNICGDCMYNEELYKIWRERAKERCHR